MAVEFKATKEDLKNELDQVMANEEAKPEEFSNALEKYVMAVGEETAAQVKAEYDELKDVTDQAILSARGIHLLTAEETKFYNEVIKTGGFDDDLVWPETIIERVFEDLAEEHPILKLITFTPSVGRVKIIRGRRTGVAVFGSLHKDLEGQLGAEFGQEEFNQLALTAFFLISNDTLDLGPRWVNRFVQLSLKEAVRDVWAKKVITGNGDDEPVGLLKDLTKREVDNANAYADKESAGTLTFAKDKIIGELGGVKKTLSKYTHKIGKDDEGVTKYRNTSGKIYLIVNPENEVDIEIATTYTNINGVFMRHVPFIAPENIITSVDVPVNKAIAFLGGEYHATQSRPEKTYEYKQTFAMKRATLYATDMLGNGMPTNNDAAVVYDLAIDNSTTETP